MVGLTRKFVSSVFHLLLLSVYPIEGPIDEINSVSAGLLRLLFIGRQPRGQSTAESGAVAET